MVNFIFTKTPLVYLIQPFWRDEAFSYLLAKKNPWKTVFLTAKDFNPPLYYFILHFWIKIFGSSEISLRSLSLIFFWGTIYVVFLFFTNVLKLSKLKSFFYLVFFIVNPLLNYYAFEARMYTMFTFLATLSFYSFWQKNKRLYFWSTLLGLLTHYFMTLVILTQIIFCLIQKKKKKKNPLRLKEILKPGLFFLPWFIFVWYKRGISFSSFWIKSLNIKQIFLTPAIIYTGYEFDFNFFKDQISWFGLFFILFVLYVVFLLIVNKNKKRNSLIILFSLWGIVIPFLIAVISLYKPLFLPRYLIFANIGLLLLLILTLERLPILIKIVIIVLLFNQTLKYNQIQINKRKKADFRKIVKEIKLLAKKDDLIYVTDILDYFPLAYYFDEKKVFIFQKSYDEIPEYVGKVLIPKEKIVYRLPIYPKKAFIINNPNSYQIQSSL